MFLVVFTNPRERLEEYLVYLCRPSRAERLFFFLSILENIFSDTDPPVKTAPGSRPVVFSLLVRIVWASSGGLSGNEKGLRYQIDGNSQSFLLLPLPHRLPQLLH